MNTEHLSHPARAAMLTLDQLQKALTSADPVQALILLPLIERATELARDIGALLAAVQESTK